MKGCTFTVPICVNRDGTLGLDPLLGFALFVTAGFGHHHQMIGVLLYYTFCSLAHVEKFNYTLVQHIML